MQNNMRMCLHVCDFEISSSVKINILSSSLPFKFLNKLYFFGKIRNKEMK